MGLTPKGDHHVGAGAKAHKEVGLLFKAIDLVQSLTVFEFIKGVI